MAHDIGHTISMTSDGSSEAVLIPGPFNDLSSKLRTIYAWGTFGGGTLTVEVSPNGTVWFPLTSPVFVAKGMSNIELKALKIKFTLAGATGPSINVVVF